MEELLDSSLKTGFAYSFAKGLGIRKGTSSGGRVREIPRIITALVSGKSSSFKIILNFGSIKVVRL